MNTIRFEKGVAEIDFQTLTKTLGYEMAKGGLPKNRPIEHHQLIDSICDRVEAVNGLSVEIDPIYCTEKQTWRVGWAGEKDECPIDKHLIQRLTTRIQIIDKSNTDMNMAVGLSYNEKGITMGFGPNIWVCANQNVFGDNLMSTYKMGSLDKLPFDKMQDVMGAWLTNYEAKKEADYGKVTLLQNTIVDDKAVKLLYGELIEEAVLANMDGRVDAPMNVTQVGSFIRASKDELYELAVGEDMTAWNLTQMGTSVLKPQNNDYTTSYQTLNNFNNFILDKYSEN